MIYIENRKTQKTFYLLYYSMILLSILILLTIFDIEPWNFRTYSILIVLHAFTSMIVFRLFNTFLEAKIKKCALVYQRDMKIEFPETLQTRSCKFIRCRFFNGTVFKKFIEACKDQKLYSYERLTSVQSGKIFYVEHIFRFEYLLVRDENNKKWIAHLYQFDSE